MLKLINITKKYQTGEFTQNALDKVNLEFGKHEFVSILGPSGSGKTTLLNIIGGLDHYSSGDLIINSKSTKHFTDSDWDAYRNNCIGFVFQNYNLITHISVLNNVEMSLTLSGISNRERKKLAMDALKEVNLERHAHKLPNQLSGGQMQRVAIARALVNNPDIILADEPTGALDSKTSEDILNLIKKISRNKLVIMVTHNEELANTYSSRIIKLKDGQVISDNNELNHMESNNDYSIKKTSMSFITALKLSFNNIKTKKGRTIITAFASSIGIIGIALILSLSNGFDKQINKFESDTLSNLPIYISAQTETEYDENDIKEKRNEMMGAISNKKQFPQTDYAIVYDVEENSHLHINNISKEYIEYVEKIDPSIITGITYYRGTNINMLYKNNNTITTIPTININFTSMPKELNNENNFLNDGYDVLYGKLPSNEYEVVIALDEKNRIDSSLVKSLGFTNEEHIDFEKLINHEFKIVLNDDYYTNMGSYYTINTNINSLYNNKNNITIKIVGIVRPKEDNTLASMTTMFTSNVGLSGISSILYDNRLIEEIISINSESKIVSSQKNLNYNILSGTVFTTDEEKNQLLTYIGADDTPYIISLYPKSFDSKDKIIEYLDKYNLDKNIDDQILYTDLASTITDLSGSIMDAITIVLIAFSAISLVVSCIMIGIITYISVLERTKEIGILRSLGARKKDIIRVFTAETFIIGVISGFIGILIARILVIPTNIIIENLTNLETVAILNPLHAIMLIAISITLTLIGGAIPAVLASKKNPVESLRTE